MGPLSRRGIRVASGIYYHGLRLLGVTAVSRRCRHTGPILCYHNVVAEENCQAGDPALHVSLERFERQLRWLVTRYQVLPLTQFVERLTTAETVRRAAAITFDDGYAGVFEHAVPVLRRLGLPATIFVVGEAAGGSAGYWWDQPQIVESLTPASRASWLSDMRGDSAAILSAAAVSSFHSMPRTHRPADWTTIRAHVGGGIEIGVHSATHRYLPALTDAELAHEVLTSRRVIHRETGIWPEFFAYPYGCSDARVRAAVREAGYRAAFSLNGRTNGTHVDRWALPRVNVPSGISDLAFEAWAAGLHG